ncbi:uncharacterized protein LOC129720487 [Wyeomyia smithii]|uniref:uncharacterized protein LOC129720487 n=1 Tax=Wyeomyia smithii TaxID=174621 RepID=UPI002467BCFD|nr:uncharacterized protein LOC129720487 [Wyeomyia smithii]
MEGPSKINTKSSIETLIKLKSARVKYIDKTDQKSDVRKVFKVLEVDSKQVDFVWCEICGAVLAWHSQKTGTKSLKSHADSHSRKRGESASGSGLQPKITAFNKPANIPKKEVVRVNQVIARGLAGDLLPFRSVEGIGFQSICQEMLNLGAKFGPLQVSDVIQSRHTIKRTRLVEVSDEILANLKHNIAQAASFPRICFTFDLWADKY